MLSKIKKYYFNVTFGLLYAFFALQTIGMIFGTFSSLKERGGIDHMVLAMLMIEWLALMAARYLKKKSSNSENGGHRGGNNHFRR